MYKKYKYTIKLILQCMCLSEVFETTRLPEVRSDLEPQIKLPTEYLGHFIHSAHFYYFGYLFDCVIDADAREQVLRQEEYNVHDVATVLKRFIRRLEEPLLLQSLYPKWLNTACMSLQKSFP